MNSEILKDFEGRKYQAMMRDSEPSKIVSYSAEGFEYIVYLQPAFQAVNVNPELDYEAPAHFMILIKHKGENVVTVRQPTLELAKSEILDRITMMLEITFAQV